LYNLCSSEHYISDRFIELELLHVWDLTAIYIYIFIHFSIIFGVVKAGWEI